jgi:hypothetical protein
MHVLGHTTIWGSYSGIGRARNAKNWYQQLWNWWTAHRAAHHEAHLVTLKARWDPKREAVTQCRAAAAPEMAEA